MASKNDACTHDDAMPNVADDDVCSIDSLSFPRQFVIWSARAWVTAFKLDLNFAIVSGDTFGQLDLQEAERALDEFLSLMTGSAIRQIDIRCMKCRLVSRDEMLFQQILAEAQNDDMLSAYEGLCQWLPPTAARLGFNSLYRFAHLLREKKLHLPLTPILDRAEERYPLASMTRH